MFKVTPEIFAHFNGAGVLRARKDEKRLEKTLDALEHLELPDGVELPDAQVIIAALVEYKAGIDKARTAKAAERERKRIAREDAENAKPVSSGFDTIKQHISKMKAGRYVLTVAQNNTDVDLDFLQSLENYCAANNATLLIAKTTYNKNGFKQPTDEDFDGLHYADQVKPYLVDGIIQLGKQFRFIANANVMVTTKWPTAGFDGVSPAGVHAIIPASKIELRVQAALKNAETKLIAATGAVTKRNYIMRKAGTIAAASHSIGAVFIDTVKDELRHLEQMEGFKGFYDLGHYYGPNGVKEKFGHIEILQLGDVHAEKMEDRNLNKAVDLIKQYGPSNLMLHDLLDFSSRNHHNIKDPDFIISQYLQGNTVKGDLEKLALVVDTLADAMDGGTIHVIESNHDLAINTWLKTADINSDPANALTFYKCKVAKCEFMELNKGRGSFNMLKYAYEHIGGGDNSDNIVFHETDESVIIAGVENGCHGHNGANGARGNPKGFAALGVKINTGHTHSPSIYGPCYTAGVTASLEMGYNIGASSWAIAHTVTYENGQRQIWFVK